MRTLITGGAGFIGSIVGATLVEAGADVTVIDDLSSGHADAVPAGAQFVEMKVGDERGIDKLLSAQDYDVCLHFAGLIAAGDSMVRPGTFFANNVGETMVLLRALVDHGVGKFIFSSSATVYGEPLYTPIDEAHRTQTVNPYGESKLMVEQALAWFTRLGHVRSASLRYFNAAGADHDRAERHTPETHLIPLAFAAAAGDAPALELYGDDYPTPDGTCIRDYIHVRDLASAHVAAIDALDDHASLVCNLGSATGSSNSEVLRTVEEVTGLKVPVIAAPRRAGDAAVLVASNELARTVLGWEPRHSSITQVVSDAWDGYRRSRASG